MKIKKLLSAALLAAGLLAAPLAQAWVTENKTAILWNKDKNNIVVIFGEKHMKTGEEEIENECITSIKNNLKKQLKKEDVGFTVESSEKQAEQCYQLNKEGEELALINQIRAMAFKLHEKYTAKIVPVEWRGNSIIQNFITFYCHEMLEVVETIQGKLSRKITTALLNSSQNKNTEKLLKLSAAVSHLSNYDVTNKLLENKFRNKLDQHGLKGTELYNYLCKDGLEEHFKHHDFTLEGLKKEIEEVRQKIEINKIKSPAREKLVNETDKKLEQALNSILNHYKDIEKNQGILQFTLQSAIKNKNMESLSFTEAFKQNWFRTLIGPLADFGFISTIKDLLKHHTTVMSYSGAAHANEIIKYFTQEAGYKIYHQPAQTNIYEAVALSPEKFKTFFEKLDEVQKIVETNKKNKKELVEKPKNTIDKKILENPKIRKMLTFEENDNNKNKKQKF